MAFFTSSRLTRVFLQGPSGLLFVMPSVGILGATSLIPLIRSRSQATPITAEGCSLRIILRACPPPVAENTPIPARFHIGFEATGNE